jgi:hypothetical protein
MVDDERQREVNKRCSAGGPQLLPAEVAELRLSLPPAVREPSLKLTSVFYQKSGALATDFARISLKVLSF